MLLLGCHYKEESHLFKEQIICPCLLFLNNNLYQVFSLFNVYFFFVSSFCQLTKAYDFVINQIKKDSIKNTYL